uniref:(northern house mosquito) hypothetical protein n=1 Tax=Culex pipiens TaxID=7175 RepID=A0A8D8DT11_CULPI
MPTWHIVSKKVLVIPSVVHQQNRISSRLPRVLRRYQRIHSKALPHIQVHSTGDFDILRQPIQSVLDEKVTLAVGRLPKQLLQGAFVKVELVERTGILWVLGQVVPFHHVKLVRRIATERDRRVLHRIVQLEPRVGADRWMNQLVEAFCELEDYHHTADT